MKPGEVIWVEFPGGAGRAQAGRRPAIVVQSADASRRLPTVLLVPLTTQQDALRFPGTVLVEPDTGNGLKHPSVALLFQLTAIDRKYLGSTLGTLSQDAFQLVWTAFDEITARDVQKTRP
jgi:mRNA-degrading endonuclease toxin of MazEF toxin-antitoxin module